MCTRFSFNVHITHLSWTHDRPSFDGTTDFIERLRKLGIVIGFDGEIIFESVLSRMPQLMASEVFQLIGRVSHLGGLQDVIIPELLCEPVEVTSLDAGNRIDDVNPLPMTVNRTKAIRLRLGDKVPSILTGDLRPIFYSVLLRADMVAAADEKFAVDGNHILGGVPNIRSGNGIQGSRFESWFGIAQ